STLAKRIRSLELLANPKMPMLILHCYEFPSDEQLAQIADAERKGQRVIMYGNKYAWCWISGDDKTPPWEENNSDYDFNRALA
ncbi:MAG: hypothetical protein ACXW09_14925, partial [Methylococcaceae bacterium]